ncbi:hypothetical protein THOG05_90014 [Vibrio rotiferianus]|nr:hypothetical protein VCHENC01_3094 [Vibrio harveyi]CAH1547173.1 hypothetical protein THOG05_90014 [Vibrio rotiferianus]
MHVALFTLLRDIAWSLNPVLTKPLLVSVFTLLRPWERIQVK